MLLGDLDAGLYYVMQLRVDGKSSQWERGEADRLNGFRLNSRQIVQSIT